MPVIEAQTLIETVAPNVLPNKLETNGGFAVYKAQRVLRWLDDD